MKMALRFPMVGTPIATPEHLKEFVSEFAESPQRGFGSNPFNFGGRMKLIEFVDKGSVLSFIGK